MDMCSKNNPTLKSLRPVCPQWEIRKALQPSPDVTDTPCFPFTSTLPPHDHPIPISWVSKMVDCFGLNNRFL